MTIRLHTLGPSGTNCEAAAKYWMKKNGYSGELILYDLLESAIKEVKKENDYLLACIVYPKLNNLYFENIEFVKFVDCFIFKTYEMVIAVKDVNKKLQTIITHPAPARLACPSLKMEYATSNAQAAIEVKNGNYDCCITTLKSANDNSLKVVKSFGEWDMGFSVHGKK